MYIYTYILQTRAPVSRVLQCVVAVCVVCVMQRERCKYVQLYEMCCSVTLQCVLSSVCGAVCALQICASVFCILQNVTNTISLSKM